jgi:PKHD-type hydroxylase
MQFRFMEDQSGGLIYPQMEGVHIQPPDLPLRHNGHVSAPLVFTGIFSAQECDAIIDLGSRQPLQVGKMMYGRRGVRRSKIAWLNCNADTRWLYEKTWHTFRAVNRWFDFDLMGLVDELQYATYETGDQFNWHLDTGGGQTSTRKISMSVQLSEGISYAGGDIEFSACSDLEPSRRRGTIIVFPSFMSHRVTPVTLGKRTSLVAWAHGPVFR